MRKLTKSQYNIINELHIELGYGVGDCFSLTEAFPMNYGELKQAHRLHNIGLLEYHGNGLYSLNDEAIESFNAFDALENAKAVKVTMQGKRNIEELLG